jgi:hypothetical protein
MRKSERVLRISAGGIVKAEGLGDGFAMPERNHRQAALDDATHQSIRNRLKGRNH